MIEFLRKNPLIVASVGLPAALIVIFALAGIVPRMLVDPPQYDLLLSQYDPVTDDSVPFSANVIVQGGKAVIRVSRPDHPTPRGRLRVYLYDSAENALVELDIDWPVDRDALEDGDQLSIPALGDRVIDTARRAPDGWEYRGIQRQSGFFFGFFGGRYGDRVTIARDGAMIPIDLPETPYYGIGQVRFVGWLTDS